MLDIVLGFERRQIAYDPCHFPEPCCDSTPCRGLSSRVRVAGARRRGRGMFRPLVQSAVEGRVGRSWVPSVLLP